MINYVVTDQHREWLCRRAIQSAPHEACGFILACGKIIEVKNVSTEPNRGFAMSQRDVIEKIGAEQLSSIVAVWHTHPSGSIKPSAIDQDALFSGAIQEHWAYLIVTKDAVTQYDTPRLIQQSCNFWESFAH